MWLLRSMALLILLIFQNGYSAADNFDLEKNLKYFAASMLHKKDEDGGYITAISMAAQCGKNKPIYIVKGTKGIDDPSSIAEDSIFQIGSITKAFVSLVVLQLAKENKISIDDNTIIKRFFPEYTRWGNITLRQLMNMTSGIPGNNNNLPDDIFKKFSSKEYFNKLDPVKLLNLTHQLPLHFTPGTQFEYSNTNYILLGQLIKKITHNEPSEEIQRRILNPLELKDTHFVNDKVDELAPVAKSKLVHGYAFYTKKSKPYPFMPYGVDTLQFSLSYTNTAGAIISTPHDINIFLHSIFNDTGLFYKYQNKLASFVSRSSGKSVLYPTINDRQAFGLGIIGFYWNEKHPLIYLYNGTTDGFNFAWIVDPKNQVYFVLAINSHADILGLNDALSQLKIIEAKCKSIR